MGQNLVIGLENWLPIIFTYLDQSTRTASSLVPFHSYANLFIHLFLQLLKTIAETTTAVAHICVSQHHTTPRVQHATHACVPVVANS